MQTEDYEDLRVLNNYVFYANTQAEKENNWRIIDTLKKVIDSKISEIRDKLIEMEEIELTQPSEAIIQNDLEDDLEKLEGLRTLYSIFEEKNPINIYRQAFILLMTAFDATIVDLYNETKTKEVSNGNKYAVNIVEKLYKDKSHIFIINEQDVYDNVLEMIQRRNLHVHRKGIVDDKYFIKGNGKQLGLHIGDYATIDYEYFLTSYEILREFVANF